MTKYILMALVFSVVGLIAIGLVTFCLRDWARDKMRDENGDRNRPL